VSSLPGRFPSLSRALLLVSVAVCLVMIAGCGSSSSAAGPTDPPVVPGWKGLQPLPPTAKPDVTLTDTSGKPFDFRQQTDGKVTILYLGYTHCPDICPVVMAQLGRVVEQLPADVASKVQVIFVTTDPDRDTPEVIRSWLDSFSTKLIGLTGSTDAIAATAKDLGLAAPTKDYIDDSGDYDIEHSAVVWAFDAQDNLSHLQYTADTGAADFEHDILRLAQKGWPGD
jgi:protein SCO1/2